jgi:hypothetical protein
MQPAEPHPTRATFKRQMPREEYSRTLRELFGDEPRFRPTDVLLIAIQELLLDIRDRLPAPPTAEGAG